ncbi:BCL2 modifying factor [Cricetulus griseus]
MVGVTREGRGLISCLRDARSGRILETIPRGEMEPPQCVEELEDDVFQPEDGEPGTQPGSLLSADLFAQSQLDCPLSRLQLFPLTHCCGPGLRPISQEDKATQTLSPASPSQGVMLPCGVTEEPQRLFYGKAQRALIRKVVLKTEGGFELSFGTFCAWKGNWRKEAGPAWAQCQQRHTGLWREGKGSEVILLCLREQTEKPLRLISEGTAHRALLEKQFWRESKKLEEACFGLEEGGGRRWQAPPAAILVPALVSLQACPLGSSPLKGSGSIEQRTLEIVPQSLSRPATGGGALCLVLGRQPGTSPARAEHRVSAEHVAESINKGGGWQARAGARCAMDGRLSCSTA